MDITEIIGLAIHIGFLTVLGIADIRKKYVSFVSLIIFFAGTFTWSVITQGFDIEKILIGIIPALILLVLKRTVKLGIGAADIAVFAITGATLGFGKSVSAMLVASAACAVFSAAKIILKKANRKSRIAFIPFMGIGVALSGLFG